MREQEERPQHERKRHRDGGRDGGEAHASGTPWEPHSCRCSVAPRQRRSDTMVRPMYSPPSCSANARTNSTRVMSPEVNGDSWRTMLATFSLRWCDSTNAFTISMAILERETPAVAMTACNSASPPLLMELAIATRSSLATYDTQTRTSISAPACVPGARSRGVDESAVCGPAA